MFGLACLTAVLLQLPQAHGIPAQPHYFENLVDHFNAEGATYSQRYYVNDTAFTPGSPIICIIGGESEITPETGIFYPSIVLMAQRLHAVVIEPEHRFFGTSLPVSPYNTSQLQLLTPMQALADTAAFILQKRKDYGCSGAGGQPLCPVITVGGSYPGFLSAMMRLRYPEVVDMAYSGSAPLLFYSQLVDQYAYYKVVTESAERASPGCPAAVRSMLASTLASASKAQAISKLNLCQPLPDYIAQGSDQVLREELAMVVMYTCACKAGQRRCAHVAFAFSLSLHTLPPHHTMQYTQLLT